MKGARDAIAVLRSAGWYPGLSTAGHPRRAAIKAALRVLDRLRVDPAGLGLAAPPPSSTVEELPMPALREAP